MGYLEVLKNLYKNWKESSKRQIIRLSRNDENEYEDDFYDFCCGCWRRRRVKDNNQIIWYSNETNPTLALQLYSYIQKNYSNPSYEGGSDPKVVAEMILSTMNKKIDSNFKYILDIEILKDNETLLFNPIFNYYQIIKLLSLQIFIGLKKE